MCWCRAFQPEVTRSSDLDTSSMVDGLSIALEHRYETRTRSPRAVHVDGARVQEGDPLHRPVLRWQEGVRFNLPERPKGRCASIELDRFLPGELPAGLDGQSSRRAGRVCSGKSRS